MLPGLQQPPSAGEWPHLEVIPSTPVAAGLEPLVPLSGGAGGASGRVAGASARETPNDLSAGTAAPLLGHPEGMGRDRTVAACQGPGLPTQPGIPGVPCQPPPGVLRKALGPCRVICLDFSPSVPPRQMQACGALCPASPRAMGPTPTPRESQTPHPCSALSPSPSVFSSYSLVARTGREGGCRWPLTDMEAHRRWAASPWDLSPFPGSAECEGSCKGHEAAKPQGHSHTGGTNCPTQGAWPLCSW